MNDRARDGVRLSKRFPMSERAWSDVYHGADEESSAGAGDGVEFEGANISMKEAIAAGMAPYAREDPSLSNSSVEKKDAAYAEVFSLRNSAANGLVLRSSQRSNANFMGDSTRSGIQFIRAVSTQQKLDPEEIATLLAGVPDVHDDVVKNSRQMSKSKEKQRSEADSEGFDVGSDESIERVDDEDVREFTGRALHKKISSANDYNSEEESVVVLAMDNEAAFDLAMKSAVEEAKAKRAKEQAQRDAQEASSNRAQSAPEVSSSSKPFSLKSKPNASGALPLKTKMKRIRQMIDSVGTGDGSSGTSAPNDHSNVGISVDKPLKISGLPNVIKPKQNQDVYEPNSAWFSSGLETSDSQATTNLRQMAAEASKASRQSSTESQRPSSEPFKLKIMKSGSRTSVNEPEPDMFEESNSWRRTFGKKMSKDSRSETEPIDSAPRSLSRFTQKRTSSGSSWKSFVKSDEDKALARRSSAGVPSSAGRKTPIDQVVRGKSREKDKSSDLEDVNDAPPSLKIFGKVSRAVLSKHGTSDGNNAAPNEEILDLGSSGTKLGSSGANDAISTSLKEEMESSLKSDLSNSGRQIINVFGKANGKAKSSSSHEDLGEALSTSAQETQMAASARVASKAKAARQKKDVPEIVRADLQMSKYSGRERYFVFLFNSVRLELQDLLGVLKAMKVKVQVRSSDIPRWDRRVDCFFTWWDTFMLMVRECFVIIQCIVIPWLDQFCVTETDTEIGRRGVLEESIRQLGATVAATESHFEAVRGTLDAVRAVSILERGCFLFMREFVDYAAMMESTVKTLITFAPEPASTVDKSIKNHLWKSPDGAAILPIMLRTIEGTPEHDAWIQRNIGAGSKLMYKVWRKNAEKSHFSLINQITA